METGAFSLLSSDADARAIERVLEIEFVTFVPTEYPPRRRTEVPVREPTGEG
jgi:hypothetical protein